MSCQHLDSITSETLISKANYPVFRCEECIKIGGTWVHLRICQSCGKMLCCNSSKHQHAQHHYQETGHPVMSSAELGEQWLWCYVDQASKTY
ncbi:MAG: UBP-type zinc finger domain-containing protein [Leptolyngbya sp. SIO4C1]|nr:UBP-type zinc finger domain-containing protein [Leptolyngbya sp. SIO4C1]